MKRKRIIVLGFMGSMPVAGVIWQHVHYIVGLQRLGHDVYYIEDTGHYPYDPIAFQPSEDYSYAAKTLKELSKRFGFEERWGFCARFKDPIEMAGLDWGEMLVLFREADCALNICGSHLILEEYDVIRNLIYVESDPGVEQIKVDRGDQECIRHLQKHHHLFTFGELIGTEHFPVPLHGMNWIPTRQPVVADLWSTGNPDHVFSPVGKRFTTICNWSTAGHKEIEWRGSTYLWSKSKEFLRFVHAPVEAEEVFEMATDLKTDEERALFRRNNWKITSPHELSMDINSYREFILNSKAEFTCAKDQYVRLNTGWFSDRSACYLAAGKPVVTQETGFSEIYGEGMGLAGFANADNIREIIQNINADYSGHSQAATRLGKDIFGAETVLTQLLTRAHVI